MSYKNYKQEKEAFNLTISDVLVLWQKDDLPKAQKCNFVKKLK